MPKMSKLGEGSYNKVFLLEMDDGKEIVAKIPQPSAGRKHISTASEVPLLPFLREELDIQVPEVNGWSSKATETELGAEYILVKKVEGVAYGMGRNF